MAYANRYRLTWDTGKTDGYMLIKEDGYVGLQEDLNLHDTDLLIEYDWSNWDDPIIGLRCVFSIINTSDDWYDFLDLMTATERKFKVIVIGLNDQNFGDGVTLFEGFLNTEANQQKFHNYSTLQLVASSYLSKLEYVYPASFDTLQNMTFIDIINEILTSIGSTSNIRVYMNTRPTEYTVIVNATALNLTGLYSEIYWKNNVERETSLDILKSILSSFNAFIYWHNGYWYIENYDVLWNTSKSYIEYVSGQTYDPSDTGTAVAETFTVKDVHSLVFMDNSQQLKVSPGNKLIQIKIDLLPLLNWTISDFSNVEDVNTNYPAPNLREWMKWNGNSYLLWLSGGLPYGDISNGIIRGINQAIEYYEDHHRGLYTCVKATIKEGTSLSIKWKYSFQSLEIGTPKYAFDDKWENYTFQFKWYLRIVMPDGAGTLNSMIIYDENDITGPRWEAHEVGGELFPGIPVSEENCMQTLEINGAEFDPNNKSYEVDINIPIDEIADAGDLDTDWTFYLCIGVESIKYGGTGTEYGPSWGIASVATLGDVNLLFSVDSEESNLIEGTINTDFLNKKEFELQLSDISNLNYKNAIFRGDGAGGGELDDRTSLWVRTAISPTERPLIDWFIIDKFRLYNTSKQRITSNVHSDTWLRLFSLFTESKQDDKKFVLTGLRIKPASDLYEVQLEEYDNETDINLIES